ncbi:spore coat protein [Geomicrobium sp. JSM 1781026]|uniref:spore coat protein n=1 Tax=Geomicrobium sp. JSM 1781026 TaxID=3344580 RepID=UPI0035BF9173
MTKIQNPKTEVPNSKEMNDKDFMTDMLTTEKYMGSSYTTAMTEASHKALYDEISSICNETIDCQRNLYNQMFANGWYALDTAPGQAIQQAHQEYAGMTNQLPGNGMAH